MCRENERVCRVLTVVDDLELLSLFDPLLDEIAASVEGYHGWVVNK